MLAYTMEIPWVSVWEASLTLAVILSTLFTIVMFTLPSGHDHFLPDEMKDSDFTEEDKNDSDRSGYSYFQKHKNAKGVLTVKSSVQVVVLGDIGRSPRMQYHALSIANHGGLVQLVGYYESEIHPDIMASRMISVVPIPSFPFRTSNRLLFLLLAPFKVLWQFQALYHALGYRTNAARWMLVQNPPSIPLLVVARIICSIRTTRLVVDWHNFGYSILSLRLGPDHLLVKISEWYEGYFARGAAAHFAVTNAMCRVLKQKWNIDALPLHDRPAKHFQPTTRKQQVEFLQTLPSLQDAKNTDLENRSWKLIVSSTSWTPDEDFSILLDALVEYSAAKEQKQSLPKIWAIITGKGPLKEHYERRIQKLGEAQKLNNVTITTAWLSIEGYASLLGSADLGVSLHTSSSGVDLPMKVVDMFGAGLPVVGWSKFEAWPELVKEGENGHGFESAGDLARTLQELFGGDGRELAELKQGALRECERRWEDEWLPVAGKLFRLDR